MKNNSLKINEKTEIPGKFKKYFWDCDFDGLSIASYPFFITERILQYGNSDSIEWLLNVIQIDFLKSVINRSRILDKKTKNYWELILK